MVSIMGASGSKKNTLLNILDILDTYDTGEYYLDNQHWAKFYLSHTLSTRCASTLGLGVNLQAGPVNFYIISDFVPLSYVKVQNFDKAIDNTIIPYRTH